MAYKIDPKLQSFLNKNKEPAPIQKIVKGLSESAQAAILLGYRNALKIEAFENDARRRYKEWSDDRREDARRLSELEKIPLVENRAHTASEESELRELQAYHDATAHMGQAIRDEKYPAILSVGLGLTAAIQEGFIYTDFPVEFDRKKSPRKVVEDCILKIERLNGELHEAGHGPLPMEDALAQFGATVRAKANAVMNLADLNKWSYRKPTTEDRLLGRTQTEGRGKWKFPTQPVVVQNGMIVEVEAATSLICAAMEPQLMAWAEAQLSKLPAGESIESRKRRIVELEAQMLGLHRVLAAALAECQRQGLEVDFPRGLILAPEALLGVEFVPAPVKGSKVSKAEDDFG